MALKGGPAAAYEERSIAVSSNVHPAGFDELMPKTLATATVDRLLHHAHGKVINTIRNLVNQSGAHISTLRRPTEASAYGRQVVVLSRRPEANVTVSCIVVLTENPAFRYRLPERWLESMPPSTTGSSAQGPIRLPLAALDTLTQRLSA